MEASGTLKVVAVSLTKIASDLRLMGSGPRAGLAEIFLPELQKGSSIMPGKENPVIPEVVTQVAAQVIGNDTAITVGGMSGQFELNVYVPLMARNLLQSIQLLASASRLLAETCVDGIEANREQIERYAELTPLRRGSRREGRRGRRGPPPPPAPPPRRGRGCGGGGGGERSASSLPAPLGRGGPTPRGEAGGGGRLWFHSAPQTSPPPEELADVRASRSGAETLERLVTGSKRTSAFAPKSVSQTLSRSST